MKNIIILIIGLALVSCTSQPTSISPPESFKTKIVDTWDYSGVTVEDLHGALNEVGVKSGLSRNFTATVHLNSAVYTGYGLVAKDSSLYNGCDSGRYSKLNPNVAIDISVRTLANNDVRMLVSAKYDFISVGYSGTKSYSCFSSGLLEAVIINAVWNAINSSSQQRSSPQPHIEDPILSDYLTA